MRKSNNFKVKIKELKNVIVPTLFYAIGTHLLGGQGSA